MHVAFAGAMNSMCAEALNSRLMLIETISFTTTPEDMLELLARVIGNRTMGSLFFDNNSVMDYELMGGICSRCHCRRDQKAWDVPLLAASGTIRL